MTNILLSIFWIFTYFINISRFPFGGDSSEIATSMSTWGLSHPPGYPLQNLMGNIFIRLIHFGNTYQKTAFISSFFILTAVFVINLTLSQYIKNKKFILLSLLFFLTLFPVWLYGIVSEVFSLALFLISFQIYFLLKYEKTRIPRYFNLFLLFIGFGVAHHHAFVLFIPGYLYILIKKIKFKFNLKIVFKSILYCLLGFSVYLYAPIVSFFNTPMDIENARTLTGFIRLILRSSYGTFTAYTGAKPGLTNQLVNIASLFVFILKDIKPLGIIIIIFGLVYLYKKIRYLFVFFIINLVSLLYFYFITNFNLAGSFSMGTFERFLVFFYFTLILIFPFGLVCVHTVLNEKLRHLTNKMIIKILVFAGFYILIFSLIIDSFYTNFLIIKSAVNSRIFENYSHNILDSLPKDSYLFLNSDHAVFLVQASQLIENYRLDIIKVPSLLNRKYAMDKFKKNNPKIVIPSMKNLPEIIKLNYPKNMFYSDKPITEGTWAPNGLVWKYFSDNNDYIKNRDMMIDLNYKLWINKYSLTPLTRNENSIFFLNHIYEIYSSQLLSTVSFLITEKQIDKANVILEKYFDALKDQYYFQLAFLYTNIIENKCIDTGLKIFEKLANGPIYNGSDYKYLYAYSKLCKRDEEKLLNKMKSDKINLPNTNLRYTEIEKKVQ